MMQPTKSIWRTRFPRAVVITLLLFIGVYSIFFLINKLDRWQQEQISRWPMVEGRVVSAEIVDRGDYDDRYEVVNVRFSYTVEEITYTSGQDMNVEQRTNYLEGSSVTVHYSPSKPKISYVDAGMYVGWGWIGALSCYPLIAAVISFIYLWGWWIRGK
jgi:hypothetical protein